MKKILFFVFGIVACMSLIAQTNQGISHQAVVRNNVGELVANSTIGVKVSILQGSATGIDVYSETHLPVSNAHGLITYIIGHGTVVGGIFDEIDWSDGPYFLKTEVDPMGGTNYSIAGTSQLLSVPYALHAKTASSFMGVGDLIIPVMASAEILNLEPHKGQTVFNSDGNLIQVYDGTNWSIFKMDCWPLPTTANAGPRQSFNDERTIATMAANTPELHYGTGQWSIISGEGGSFDDDTKPDAEFTGQPCTSYQLRWTITAACGSSSSNVNIVFNYMPTSASAGPDQFLGDGTTSTILEANTPTVGNGQWSIISGEGGSFDDDTKPDALFTGQMNTTYTIQWKISTQCNASEDLVRIYFIVPNFGETLTDIDGNTYKTVWIGDQLWMAENLRTTRDSQENPITRYCYDDDPSYCDLYGGLYDWETLMNGAASSESNPSGVQGICPTGWHVPSDAEWEQLLDYVIAQGFSNERDNLYGAANALKSCRQVDSPVGGQCSTTVHPRWDKDESSGFNHYGFEAFGFSALPCGFRNTDGSFYTIGSNGYWWSATEFSSSLASIRDIPHCSGNVGRYYDQPKTAGFSLRCIRDSD